MRTKFWQIIPPLVTAKSVPKLLRAISLLALLCLLAPFNSQAADPKLVTFFDFNDDADPANTVDKMYGIIGALEGPTFTLDGEGRTGNAGDKGMDINNAGLVRIVDATVLNQAAANDQVTVAFWQKLHGVKNSSAFWFASPSSSSNQRGIQAHTPWSDNTIYFDSVGCCTAGSQRLNINNTVDYTVWNHLAFVKNGGHKEIWFNGAKLTEGDGATALPTDFTQQILGAELGGANSLNGILDDFIVVAGALSADQIGQLAGGTEPDKVTGLIIASEHPSVTVFTPTGAEQATDVAIDFTLVDGSVATVTKWELTLDGTLVKSGTTAGAGNQAAPVGGYALGSRHTAVLTYTDSSGYVQTSQIKFSIKPFGPGTLFVEAEDFNGSEDGILGGEHVEFGDPDCSFLGKNAVLDVDYHEVNNGNDQNLYRPATGVEGGKPGTDGFERGENTITCSYIVGWNDAGDWYNYTRTFPGNSAYKIYARLASGGAAEHAKLSLVTSDPTLPDQTLSDLGEFTSPATGNWDVFHTVPLTDASGNDVIVRLSGLKTLRFTTLPGNLDFNYVAFVPTAVDTIRPVLTQQTPAPGSTSLRDPLISVTIGDRDTKVKGSSIKLFLNGAELLPLTLTEDHTAGGLEGARASFQTTSPLAVGSTATAKVTFDDDALPPNSQTVEWTFLVGEIKSNSLFIEAEDFNYSEDGVEGGLHANFGDPDCSLLGKNAVPEVDYHEGNNGNDQNIYRGPTGVEAGKLGVDSYQRGANTVTCSYIVGWNDAGDWYNYTRDFGASKRYNVYARLSSGGAAESAELAVVTTDPTQPDQEKTPLGQFNSPATGNWDIFHTVPLRNTAGDLVSVKLSGLTTLRFTTLPGNLDYNWLALVPADVQTLGPTVETVVPAKGSDYARAPLVTAVIQDQDLAVDPASVKLSIDGGPSVGTVTDTATGAMIEYQMGAAGVGVAHTAKVDYKDTAGTSYSTTWSWTEGVYNATANLFIEAEDWNYEGGSYLPSNPASGEPFNKKSLYNGLVGVHDVDYHNNGNPENDLYRTGDTPNIGLADISSDANVRGAGPRPGFDVQNDWKVGWNDPGDWFNYTRTFPPGNYNIYARLSSGGADRHAHLDLVSNPKDPEPQALSALGRFDAPTTGGWDTFSFVPLKNDAGELAVVPLGGEQTLRFTADPGNFDFNYLMLCPLTPDAPRITSITYNRANNTVTVEWTGGGELQVSDNVTGPWVTVDGSTSPLTAPVDRVKRFARVVRK